MMRQPEAKEVLRDYIKTREMIDPLTKKAKRLHDLLVAHIEASGETMYDPVLEVSVSLQVRRGADRYDLASMPDELVRWAADHFILSADDKLVRKFMDSAIEAVEMRRFATPGGETKALVVRDEREKEEA